MTATIYAVDLARMTEFYCQVLGLSIVELLDNDFAQLASPDGAIEISIVAIPREIADEITFDNPVSPREDTPIKLSFVVDDPETSGAHARALGGALRSADEGWSWNGFIHCDGHDPEGNVFQTRSLAPGPA
jgi:catechol 2,3-dioxygenase-like lactoylglutathione lyase family enzyme